MKLIANWRRAHRLWSLRLNLIGLLLALAEQAAGLWPSLPAEARAWLPAWLPIPFFALAAVARLVRQERLEHAEKR